MVGLLEARLPPGVELRPAVGVDAVRVLLLLPNIGFGTGRLGGAEGRERERGAGGASLAMGGTPSPAVLGLFPLPAVPFPLLIVG